MSTPYLQTLTLAIGATKSSAAFVFDKDIRCIEYDGTTTAATFVVQSANVTDRAVGATQPADAAFAEVFDSAGTTAPLTKVASKRLALSEVQRDHLKSGHWIRLVGNTAQLTVAATIILSGRSTYT